MKTTLLALIALVVPSSVRAAAGEIDAPAVAHAAGFPEAARLQIAAALKREDCRFLGGHWLNAWTTLRYAGDTRALNLFIEDLTQCPGVTVSVSFKHSLPDEAVWCVGHSAHSNRFQIEISAERIELDELVIPEVKGPTL
jgi:hypothetical protein